MTTLRQAAQQVLEALKDCVKALDALHAPGDSIYTRASDSADRAEIALRAALAQEEQEPVAFADRISFDQAMKSGKGHDVWPEAGDYEARTGRKLRVLYTQTPRREWHPLTDKEIRRMGIETPGQQGGWNLAFARAIEQALKEKNNG